MHAALRDKDDHRQHKYPWCEVVEMTLGERPAPADNYNGTYRDDPGPVVYTTRTVQDASEWGRAPL